MKKIINLTGKLAVLILMLSLTGCYYDELQERTIPVVEDNVSFATDIQDIFNVNNCMQCHTASRNPDLREGFAFAALVPTYVTPNDADGSLLLTKLVDGHRSVSTTEIALIKAWIEQGAENN